MQKYIMDNCLNCNKEFKKLNNVKNHKFCCYDCKKEYYRKNPKQEEVVCSNCNKLYNRRKQSKYNNNFCCLECEFEFKYNQSHEIRKCDICGKEFECLKSAKLKLCSIQCQGKWQSIYLVGKNANGYNEKFSDQDRTLNCEWCNKPFGVSPYKINKARFCSNKCRQTWYSNIFSQSDEWKEKSKIRAVKMLEDGINGNKTNTEIQTIINNLLNNLSISYVNEKGFKYVAVDNYLDEYNLIIEVMGTYWHCDNRFYPTINYEMQVNRIRMDKIKHINIKKDYNIEILYLWEYDIINNQNLCSALIKEYINNKGVLNNYHSFNYNCNNTLTINEKVIIPYMQWDIEKLKNIIDLTVKEKMSHKQLDKWITFNCEHCGKEKEELISHYNKKKHHYCSRECCSNSRIERIEVSCHYCGENVDIIESKYKKYKHFFCNKECYLNFKKEYGFKKII